MAEPGTVRSLADHQSLRERIVARLRQAIITGDLSPTSRLIEPELARQLNVSRTPLREAIRQLEAEGFVTTVPRVGCFVSEITPQDAADVYAIRTVIEGLAARQAAENPDPAKREALENDPVGSGETDRATTANITRSPESFTTSSSNCRGTDGCRGSITAWPNTSRACAPCPWRSAGDPRSPCGGTGASPPRSCAGAGRRRSGPCGRTSRRHTAC